MQVLAYLAMLFVVFGSWAIPHLFASWIGGSHTRTKTAGLWLMVAVDAVLIWFWFRYGFG